MPPVDDWVLDNAAVVDDDDDEAYEDELTALARITNPTTFSVSAFFRIIPWARGLKPRSPKMTAAAAPPSSSPRLPSPPPFTEVQIGPKSPTVGDGFGSGADELLSGSAESNNASTRRIRPGTKAAHMSVGPPLVPLAQLDSPFQLQEHLMALYKNHTRPADSTTITPITREVAEYLAEPPEGVERSLWLYELCRFLTMNANNLIVAFFAEDPPCSAQTCPEMRASEWQYLCAVHDPPKSCCAIDYCCHTLDWAGNTLTSPKYFPSRLTLGSEAAGGPQTSIRHLTNIFRRVYRIFAHAWFQHRDVFWQVEGHDGLYVFFKTVCDMYHLIPDDGYTIPPEAEGELPRSTEEEQSGLNRRMTILRKEPATPVEPSAEEETGSAPSALGTAATTRRHKHSPSTGISVSTIAEATEDDEQGKAAPAPEEQPVVILPDTTTSASEDAPEEPAESIAETSTNAEDESKQPSEEEHKPQSPTEVEVPLVTDDSAPAEAKPETTSEDVAENPVAEAAESTVETAADVPEAKDVPEDSQHSKPEEGSGGEASDEASTKESNDAAEEASKSDLAEKPGT
ncbi:hypothetical protein AJ80_07728 [Polytolypa hystricis UAMH7299]|uniref:Mob1 family protein n=1 Tax=Polytolypa hystricis (strain UAMH7299) TaxID=1447883 RepID=A0A2B7XKD8_POLH7|nr:hypothetical protein AJ80_07728 [Polytolypa hystricis UAMH7299]